MKLTYLRGSAFIPHLKEGVFPLCLRAPRDKGIIVRKKLEKKSTSQIAKETNHSPEAVDRYIRDYGRVKMLIGKRMTVEEISYATGISRGVVEQYKDLYELENSDNSEKKE